MLDDTDVVDDATDPPKPDSSSSATCSCLVCQRLPGVPWRLEFTRQLTCSAQCSAGRIPPAPASRSCSGGLAGLDTAGLLVFGGLFGDVDAFAPGGLFDPGGLVAAVDSSAMVSVSGQRSRKLGSLWSREVGCAARAEAVGRGYGEEKKKQMGFPRDWEGSGATAPPATAANLGWREGGGR